MLVNPTLSLVSLQGCNSLDIYRDSRHDPISELAHVEVDGAPVLAPKMSYHPRITRTAVTLAARTGPRRATLVARLLLLYVQTGRVE